MRHLALLAGLALAACAQGAGHVAQPVAAAIGGERLAVTFSDGQVCHAAVPLTGGTGTFGDCPDRGGWRAEIRKRNLLEPILGAAVSPYGRIVVTSPGGREWVFLSPSVARQRP